MSKFHQMMCSYRIIALWFGMGISGAVSAQAEKKPAVQLNHIAYLVSNLQKSTDFYRNIIGLDTIPEPFHDGKHTWMRLSEHGQLHLIAGTPPARPEKGNHLCVTVVSFSGFLEKIQKAEIPFENWLGAAGVYTTRPDGIRQLYLRDPDGYWLEVNDDWPSKTR